MKNLLARFFPVLSQPTLTLDEIAGKPYHFQILEYGRWMRSKIQLSMRMGIDLDVMILVFEGALDALLRARHAADPNRSLKEYYLR
jgi:hypothetical protein